MNFLRNSWYVAAWADEIGRSLLSRRILDTPILFYRTAAGAPIALLDRCPHRWAPLHRGVLVGDSVQCGYHGLQFGGDGRCNHNPFSDHTPAAARVRSFPMVEKDSLVWIWMGEPERADAAAIIDCGYLVDKTNYRTIKGRTSVAANYALLIDNLMDLSHSKYIHSSSFGTDALTNANYRVSVEGLTVHSDRWYLEGPSLPLLEKFLPTGGKPVEHWVNMRWDAASNLVLDLGMTLSGRPRKEGWTALSPNILTPETDRTTHYFYAYSRTMHLESTEVDEILATTLGQAFGEEDAPMLEAIQAQIDSDPSLAEFAALIPADEGSVRARRILSKLIAQEAG